MPFHYQQFLSQCVVGASLEEAEEENEDAASISSVIEKPKEGCYEIVGTIKNQEKPKPDFAKEIISVSSFVTVFTFIVAVFMI